MAYVVLARKYRPQTFAEIVGQEPITRTLRNALAQSRVHHAYLFCGSRGVGKTTTARVLARALNCDRGPTPDPCGKCVSCEEIRNGTAVDVLEIDGASNNSVENVRELCENARYLPARGRRKVYVIDEVHMLSQSAFNALLKTLEEPPDHVSFVFATTEPHKIPATILSRCQRFDFRRLSDAQLRTHLAAIVSREGMRIDEAGIGLIARVAEGSGRDALSLLDQVVAYAGGDAISEPRVAEILGVADRRSLIALADGVLARDAGHALAVVDEIFRAGHDLGRFAQSFLAHLRDLVVASSVREPEPLLDMTDGERADVVRQAAGAERTRLLAMFDRLAAAADVIARAQSPKVVLEVTILDLLDAEPLVPLGDLLDRLEGLESRLAGVTPASVPSPARPDSSRGAGESRAATRAATRGATPAAPTPADRGASPADPAPAGRVGTGGGGSSPMEARGGCPPNVVPGRGGGSSVRSSGGWPDLFAAIEDASPRLAGIFALAKPLRVDEAEIVLGFDEGSYELDQARERADELARFASSRRGAPVRVRVEAARAAAPAPPSVAQVEQARRDADRERRKQEALDHPAVRAAVEMLGGDVREVKAD